MLWEFFDRVAVRFDEVGEGGRILVIAFIQFCPDSPMNIVFYSCDRHSVPFGPNKGSPMKDFAPNVVLRQISSEG